ncbi:MAG: hypothetical protein A3E02_01270 [Candidatus Zambryskibacteria bacterium RIFCSPHIGHO2_12_FULL_38_34]|uniref:Prepilin-type N-terminal cleavage/methylation domain-containing protein n=1 Tax=Candidatus Zambryskibacteria bacterium RIFCSPLOWO2_12_FULL_39_16 TaxID=1802775 RepID=A0A1G2UTW7_9BACT|nr:MAG: hypothetical protein A3D37_01625 [Candidatus Zambryskibacteria bacterium RIFCSPHIGHO2_02_FULL_38_22]OHA97558.1 MAG: hypothetical protein A3E02_01270 [Candidatus Zambryskibacteria bacterium RIFCSPHIGHO2_12_FULL_38_34]OHB08143.1 MAG: hypothetical protein A3I19_02470 [Candidatus Zambryskibacteria bacterium RIFCSPLOWO2_02_FULL_38_13]OHB12837.1 MAG: hypothetical protein A3G46_02365 [Candidatus Zambryskibacteria bacterium RIFCSPLOWO2_12_FULL_39_16]
MKNKFKNQSGFTLVEMLIAISLFIAVVTISIGALLSIFDANSKAQATKTVVDNLNLSIENMTRIVRFGSNYYCGISSNENSVSNCSGGGNSFSVTFDGSRIIYRLSGTTIQRSDNGGSYTDITSPETVIQYLRFYVFGSDTSDSIQPYVIVVIKGYVGNKPTTQSIFSIETLMSQRKLDFN